MNKKYIHIKVLFSQIQPELLRQRLVYGRPSDKDYQIGSAFVSEACYLHAAHSVPELACCTQDELMQRGWALQEILGKNLSGGILRLIADYGLDVLHFQNGEPVCRQEYLFSWRNYALEMGQDLFTCAGLAQIDLQDHCTTTDFIWPPIVRTDRVDLQHILEEGVAENHYHMNGSTQMFSLSWCFLMNHPEYAEEYFGDAEFKEDLDATYSFGICDNRISWPQRIREAAWLRQALFLVLHGQQNPNELLQNFQDMADSPAKLWRVKAAVANIRMYLFKDPEPEQRWKRLDYALWKDGRTSLDFSHSSCRLLAGERYLLYQCFRRCYNGELSSDVCDLFYLYLLYKIRFRKEIIQTNRRTGFRNFSDYQNRKALLWEQWEEYWAESCRLSAANTLFRPSENTNQGHRRRLPPAPVDSYETRERCVTSLELRIMPPNKPEELKRKILNTDLYILRGLDLFQDGYYYGWQEDLKDYLSDDAPFFYVLHFAKKPLKRIEKKQADQGFPILRNGEIYCTVECQAKATAEALSKSSYLSSRVRGIDACSHEIGCRPETFATAFRYLRSFPPGVCYEVDWVRYHPLLYATYHAGEDFLDLTDGLRAIDEAICFLNLESGERIGHALALGTIAEKYYLFKGHCVVLPAQDLLDNLVWLLFRTMEWDIPMSGSLRSKLETLATKLLDEIYGEIRVIQDSAGERNGYRRKISLTEYYQFWKLRGDDPKLYELAVNEPNRFAVLLARHKREDYTLSPYQRAQLNRMKWQKPEELNEKDWDEAMFRLREDSFAQSAVYAYFYDPVVRFRGQQEKRFLIMDDYIRVIHVLQNRMMEKIAKRGIAIECNPSSNQLIGTFGTYKDHPIFRFNHAFLPLDCYADQTSQLCVSVNTDDLGIFDTSLENEYALLYSALQEYRDSNGKQLIGNTAICRYLETLRRMGQDMVFPKAKRSGQTRQTESTSFFESRKM